MAVPGWFFKKEFLQRRHGSQTARLFGVEGLLAIQVDQDALHLGEIGFRI
jgi:hypothetical protein